MIKLLHILAPLGIGGAGPSHCDDDIVDRLNHDITVMVLVLFAIIVSQRSRDHRHGARPVRHHSKSTIT